MYAYTKGTKLSFWAICLAWDRVIIENIYELIRIHTFYSLLVVYTLILLMSSGEINDMMNAVLNYHIYSHGLVFVSVQYSKGLVH